MILDVAAAYRGRDRRKKLSESAANHPDGLRL